MSEHTPAQQQLLDAIEKAQSDFRRESNKRSGGPGSGAIVKLSVQLAEAAADAVGALERRIAELE